MVLAGEKIRDMISAGAKKEPYAGSGSDARALTDANALTDIDGLGMDEYGERTTRRVTYASTEGAEIATD